MTDIFFKHLATMPILAVLRGITPSEVVTVGETLVQAGITLLEVTMDSPDAATSLTKLQQHFGNQIFLAAGTVLKPEQVAEAKMAGAKAIIAPNLQQSVIMASKSHGLLSLPGVFTPTECFSALDHGADGLKLFPGDGLSPKVVAGLRAVLGKDIILIVTGGVNADNLSQWLLAGLNGVGIGTALYKPGKAQADLRLAAGQFVQSVRTAQTQGWR